MSKPSTILLKSTRQALDRLSSSRQIGIPSNRGVTVATFRTNASSHRALPIAGPSEFPPLVAAVAPTLSHTSPIRRASTITPNISSSSTSLPPPSPSSTPISHPPIKVTAPDLQAIKEEGYHDDDVALVPPDQARLVITPEAVAQLVSITSREPADVIAQGKLALRVGVESGGCHGYQYTMAITEDRGVDDYVFQPEGVSCIPVVIDLTSLGLIKGATLHHATELIGSSFRIENNPQAKQGGACGCGVSWEANI